MPDHHRPHRGRLRRALFILASLAVAAALLVGFFGRYHAALDSFAHFRAHLAVVGTVVALLGIVALSRVRAAALLLLVLCAVAGVTAAPFVVPLADRPGGPATWPARFACAAGAAACPGAPADSETFTLLQMNLLRPSDPEAAIGLIDRYRPDFVTLQEMGREFLSRLEAAGVVYPHVATCPGSSSWLGILSRHPFSGGDGICAHREGFLSRTVDVGGVAMTLGAEHLRWPWPFSQWLHIRALAPELGGLEAPIVIGGDFNAVPWSAAVTTFADLSGTRPVPGVGATWLHPALPEGWRAWVGLPIDHVLVSEDVQILSVTRLPPTASDHLPVLVRFRLITGD